MPDHESWILRQLTGQLTDAEARRFEERLATDTDFAATHRRLAAVWHDLDEPPLAATAQDPRLAERIVARVRHEQATLEGNPLATAPAWARLGSALALGVGLWIGGSLAPAPNPIDGPVEHTEFVFDAPMDANAPTDVDTLFQRPLGLAESFWLGADAGDLDFGEGPTP